MLRNLPTRLTEPDEGSGNTNSFELRYEYAASQAVSDIYAITHEGEYLMMSLAY